MSDAFEGPAAMREFTVEHDANRVFGKTAIPVGEGPWPVVVFSHGFSACRVYDNGMERPFVERGLALAAVGTLAAALIWAYVDYQNKE